MDIVGKNIKIHLTTPLVSVEPYGSVSIISGKILHKMEDGVLVQIESVEPKKESSKYAYATIFVPTHKIDFIGVVS